jgi:hypothetical protein
MLQKLVHCLLALALAAVFAGETASAGGPCGQQQAEAVAAEAHHAEPCHETGDAAKSTPEPAKHSDKQHAGKLCDCIALLKASMAEDPQLASAHIEPWLYAKLEAVAFASLDLVPDGPPPKA